MNDIENWLTTGEASRKIGISPSYLVRLAHDKKIKGTNTKLGYLFDPASVDAYIQRREALRLAKEREAQAQYAAS